MLNVYHIMLGIIFNNNNNVLGSLNRRGGGEELLKFDSKRI